MQYGTIQYTIQYTRRNYVSEIKIKVSQFFFKPENLHKSSYVKFYTWGNFCVRQFMQFSFLASFSFLCLLFLFIFMECLDILVDVERKKRMRQKKGELHELLFTEMVKSGTIRRAYGCTLYSTSYCSPAWLPPVEDVLLSRRAVFRVNTLSWVSATRRKVILWRWGP